MARKKVFDTATNQVASQSETTSNRIRNKLRHRYDWYYCELCYRQTEYSEALNYQVVYKKLNGGSARKIVLSDAMKREAQQMADELVARFELALKGIPDAFEAGKLKLAYCDMVDMQGDFSVENFRAQVSQYSLNYVWAKHGDLVSKLRMPAESDAGVKPSRLYCRYHNPRRSVQARRNYQRDRRYFVEYQDLITTIWSLHAGNLPPLDLRIHDQVRRAAYDFVQLSKKSIHIIDMYHAQGITNGEQIAGVIKMTRQAISVARKRHSKDDIQTRLIQAKKLEKLIKKIFGSES